MSLQPKWAQKTKCPSITGGSVASPAPATLRITDGHQGNENALVMRRKAFQLTAEEARASPDVVISMCPSFILFIALIFMLINYYVV